jgi:carbamoyl-phosphate synthase large subunit
MHDTDFFLNDPVLVWGIAGASLGMEVAKSLKIAGFQTIVGCDISSIAFGHFSDIFSKTFKLDANDFTASLDHILDQARPRFVIAGGDLVSKLMGTFKPLFDSYDCRICGNSDNVIQVASDKLEVILKLASAGFRVPLTQSLDSQTDLLTIPLPSVLKPRFDSGGSRGVYVARTLRELEKYAKGIIESKTQYIAQEYITDCEGEFTVGVLSDTSGVVAGSIPLRRTFQNMLSVHERGEDYLVSSGSSQGYFEHNKKIQHTSEAIARVLGSVGPLNIQARYHQGELLPFEINPRFSASTYLRALSGVNEVALTISHLKSGKPIEYPSWNEGMALRSFSEIFVPNQQESHRV